MPPTTDQPTDGELCARWRAGDAVAAELLVRRHGGFLRTLTRAMLPWYHPDFDDCLQEAAIALLRAARTYDPAAGTMTGYARMPCVGAVLKCLRRTDHGRAGELPDQAATRFKGRLVELDSLLDIPVPEDPEPAAPPAWLRAALDGLPTRQRRALALLYGLDGEATVPETVAAERLRLTRNACHGLIHRAMTHLRRAGETYSHPPAHMRTAV